VTAGPLAPAAGAPPRPPAGGRGAWDRAFLAAGPALLGALRPLPPPWPERALAAAALLQAGLAPDRLRRAWGWAGAFRAGRRARLGLALRLLANRGRFLAFKTGLAPRVLVLEGREHVDAALARGGAILLGFHVGPGGPAPAVRQAGYALLSGGHGWRLDWRPPGNQEAAERTGSVRWHDTATRATGLAELRSRLLAGGLVHLTGDGLGREAFRIPVAGRTLPVRSGWLVLRRQTGATVLPVLSHLEGPRALYAVHPPLPPPLADPDADAEACRQSLARLLGEHAQRWPEQWPGVALARGPASRAASAASPRPAGAAREAGG
jgi:hypothetical protein